MTGGVCFSGHQQRQEKCTYRRVVQDRPDIAVLDLIEWIDSLDTVIEELVEDETYTSTARQFIEGQIICRAIDGRPEF